ncbi:MAG: hypothetical protein AXA67_01745 [Methylothermaceae bacteria B42]|nr:MAG: hypothetical protein AXA67_01745 [Methylothermaceae bacteria B42]HHJ38046.1 5-bromo-4-chloroindolyl phosphate hydrolase [Methylothermaceae bacterium]
MTDSKPEIFVRKPRKPRIPRGLLLYLLPFPLVPGALISLVRGDLYGVIVNTTGYVLYCLAARWLQQGLEEEHKPRHMVLGKKTKFKTRAALLVAGTTAALSWLGAGYSLWIVPAFGLGALWGMYLNYGFDARARLPKNFGIQDAEAAAAIEEAETLLEQIEAANRQIQNREFNERIERILEIAQQILDEIAHDPTDLRRARKFLKVYLDGARKVTEGYARTHRQAESPQLEQNFRQLLETIEQVFQQQQQKLLENELFDLDVQIEVLQTRLKQEGLLKP